MNEKNSDNQDIVPIESVEICGADDSLQPIDLKSEHSDIPINAVQDQTKELLNETAYVLNSVAKLNKILNKRKEIRQKGHENITIIHNDHVKVMNNMEHHYSEVSKVSNSMKDVIDSALEDGNMEKLKFGISGMLQNSSNTFKSDKTDIILHKYSNDDDSDDFEM